ncbi:MAG TPA: (2Fe-2S)-binding protein [Chloroflexota bacterium]|nr:(2Fe-2S)-binding protein [Chloroflexota bacterium]
MEPAPNAPGARLVKVKGPGPVPVCLRVNDRLYCLPLEPRCSLLDALRQHLGLTGTKRVCNLGECGACTVLLDSRPINACITLAVECDGRSITTIEGIATDGRLDPLQEAFIRCDAVQCGFCTPGQIMAARAFLARNPNPSEEQIRRAMAGNLCRCGTYDQIVQAVRLACRDGGAPSADCGRPDAAARRRR